MASPLKTHTVIFPFMAQGHTLPLLDLSKALSRRGIKVTIITTPSNTKSIAHYTEGYPHISVTEIPFPTISGLPEGCENTSQLPSMDFYLPFLQATKQLQKPFEQVLQRMSESGTLPICVISDFFLGWTLSVCQAFGVPRLVFHGMGVLPIAIVKTAWAHVPHLKLTTSADDPLDLPSMKLPFILTSADLPDIFSTLDHDDPYVQFISEVVEAEINSWGAIVNSFIELERSHIPSFESFYRNGAKAWCLGPLFLHDQMEDFNNYPKQNQSTTIMKWLTEHATPATVIYISFGTQADVSDTQLDEVAFGLEESGFSFVWVVRSTTWSPPVGLEERVKGRGLIVRDFVDQHSILAHCATGGFLSHCGWNSVLESVSAGVPILAWPMIAEQALNAKIVVEGLGVGINFKRVPSVELTISQQVICEGVRELMGGETGRIARERAESVGREARRAVQEGGSSHDMLSKLISQLCACHGNGTQHTFTK